MSQFLSCTNHDKTKSYEKCYKTNSQSSLVIGIRSHFYIYQRKIWQRLCQYNQEWEREREREREIYFKIKALLPVQWQWIFQLKINTSVNCLVSLKRVIIEKLPLPGSVAVRFWRWTNTALIHNKLCWSQRELRKLHFSQSSLLYKPIFIYVVKEAAPS